MIHSRGHMTSQSATNGAVSRSAAYLYFYYYAPATRTVSYQGVRNR